MATIKEYFYNIECDHCKRLANEEMWNNEPVRDEIITDEHWQHLGGKDYCPDCWHYDDDDHIVTADGKVWNEDTEEEIERLYEDEYGYDPDKRMSPTRPQETRRRFICYDCKLWDSLAHKCRGDEWDKQECRINEEE